MPGSVLVVDDDRTVLTVLTDMLEDLGCDVSSAANRQDALDQIRQNDQMSPRETPRSSQGAKLHADKSAQPPTDWQRLLGMNLSHGLFRAEDEQAVALLSKLQEEAAQSYDWCAEFRAAPR